MFEHPNHPSEVEDIHKGKRAIVCGSAPSLNDIDFDKVSDNNIIFACNQSVTAMSKCDYFCMTDHAVPKNNFFEYGVNISTKIATWGDFYNAQKIKDIHDQLKDKIYFFERDGSNMFDFNKKDKFIVGVDSVQCATHLAYITGCNEIVLAGVDLQHTDGKIYCDSKIYEEEVDWNGHVSDNGTLDLSFNNWKDIVSNNDATFLTVNKESRLTQLMQTLPIKSLYC
jgi:hypothetical protein|tara:strand:+ start:16062 stop:16736 length:675 start_codon:yes stop_codon:yes gene_type:complete